MKLRHHHSQANGMLSMEAEENRNLFLERNKNNRHERVNGMRLSIEGHSPLRVSMLNTCKVANTTHQDITPSIALSFHHSVL